IRALNSQLNRPSHPIARRLDTHAARATRRIDMHNNAQSLAPAGGAKRQSNRHDLARSPSAKSARQQDAIPRRNHNPATRNPRVKDDNETNPAPRRNDRQSSSIMPVGRLRGSARRDIPQPAAMIKSRATANNTISTLSTPMRG